MIHLFNRSANNFSLRSALIFIVLCMCVVCSINTFLSKSTLVSTSGSKLEILSGKSWTLVQLESAWGVGGGNSGWCWWITLGRPAGYQVECEEVSEVLTLLVDRMNLKLWRREQTAGLIQGKTTSYTKWFSTRVCLKLLTDLYIYLITSVKTLIFFYYSLLFICFNDFSFIIIIVY